MSVVVVRVVSLWFILGWWLLFPIIFKGILCWYIRPYSPSQQQYYHHLFLCFLIIVYLLLVYACENFVSFFVLFLLLWWICCSFNYHMLASVLKDGPPFPQSSVVKHSDEEMTTMCSSNKWMLGRSLSYTSTYLDSTVRTMCYSQSIVDVDGSSSNETMR